MALKGHTSMPHKAYLAKFPPLLFRNNHQPVNLLNTFYGDPEGSGGHCVFVGSGPSLRGLDASLLRRRGIQVFAVNNVAARTVRATLWACTDEPDSFHPCIWLDPTLPKMITKEHYIKVKHYPNVFYYVKNEEFKVSTYLEEDTVNFGNDKYSVDELGNKGRRSTMLCAIKLMYYLGIRHIYLLGCDFHMKYGEPYCFEQKKWTGGCESNNIGFDILSSRFQALLPEFEAKGLHIVNCTPESKLEVFPSRPLLEILDSLVIPPAKEGELAGMYGGIE